MASALLPLIIVFVPGVAVTRQNIAGDSGPNRAASSRFGCPKNLDGARLPEGRGAKVPVPLRHRLVAVQVCRYFDDPLGVPEGHPSKVGTLAAQLRGGAGAARQLASEFDLLRLYPRYPEYHCDPEGLGGAYVVFRYRSQAMVPLIAHFSGCRQVITGRATRAFSLTHEVERSLRQLTPGRHRVGADRP